ncbi:MAG: hypothetical protein K1W01_06990 [Muribaculaceae bacterium]
MTATEMEHRLSQLRTGFDIVIERTLRDKASKGRPIIVVAPDGSPVMRSAKNALADFYRNRRRKPVKAV